MKDNKFLEKHNEICYKIRNTIEKGFDSESVYKIKYLKTKLKFYEEKVNTNFHNDQMPKQGSYCISLSVMLIKSVLKMGKNYYP